MNMNKKIVIAVDFDGTLFTEEYPEIGKPIWRVINWCKRQKQKGNTLILWTCRAGKDLQEAIEQCAFVGLTFDYVNENVPERTRLYGNDCRKIGADIYLDDRAVNIEKIV